VTPSKEAVRAAIRIIAQARGVLLLEANENEIAGYVQEAIDEATKALHKKALYWQDKALGIADETTQLR